MTSHLSVTGKKNKICIPEILAPYFSTTKMTSVCKEYYVLFNGKMVSMRTNNVVA
jgi:hypothetical protein